MKSTFTWAMFGAVSLFGIFALVALFFTQEVNSKSSINESEREAALATMRYAIAVPLKRENLESSFTSPDHLMNLLMEKGHLNKSHWKRAGGGEWIYLTHIYTVIKSDSGKLYIICWPKYANSSDKFICYSVEGERYFESVSSFGEVPQGFPDMHLPDRKPLEWRMLQ